MDDQKLDKILNDMDVPAIDENAKKRALNLAMAEFDAHQKEKEKKFQGFSLLGRLMGNHKDKTHKQRRDPMAEKSRKNFIYGGMATAAAVIIVAGIGLQQAPQYSMPIIPSPAETNTIAMGQATSVRGKVSEPVSDVYRQALETRNLQDSDGAQEESMSFVPKTKSTDSGRKRDQLGMVKNAPQKKLAEKEFYDGRAKAKLNRAISKDEAEVDALAPMASSPAIAPAREMLKQQGFASTVPMEEKIIITDDDTVNTYYQDEGRDQFQDFVENPFKAVNAEPVSTFSVDVDTASYSFMRRQLNHGVLPQKDAIRIEELINYFDYNYDVPEDKSVPFKPSVTVTDSPWNAGKKLMHIGIKGYEITDEQPNSNIVFLLDVSGSMNSPDKLPLVKNSMKMLLNSLKPDDTVSIAVYAGAAGTVLEPTKASEKAKIIAAFDRLSAGGSTAGAAGINLAYQLAEQNFDEDAVNRVILATDGDFNVGISNREELKDFVERKREKGVFLSVLGFGQGNYNDHLMQALAQNGNGVAAYIDNLNEARKVLVEEATSSLFPIAKDVKIQIEFNPALVSEYRLVGYETRALKREDFNNDAVDAGDIGAGHTVTAIYEYTPAGATQMVDPLRYGAAKEEKKHNLDNIDNASDFNQEIAFLKMRYKLPKENVSKLITQPVTYTQHGDGEVTQDTEFATAVASFAQILKGGKYTGKMNYDDVINLANASKGEDKFGYRAEFIQLVRLAQSASAMQPR